jgi:probable HAF family extracellular repeat protein
MGHRLKLSRITSVSEVIMNKIASTLAICAAAALVVACGGGGGDGAIASRESPAAVNSAAQRVKVPLYSVTDITRPGQRQFQAQAINKEGEVTGLGYPLPVVPPTCTATTRFNAFLYSDGTMHDLGGLRIPPLVECGYNAFAIAINDKGQIVGYAALPDTINLDGHAFLYSDGAMQDLGRPTIDRFPAATGINNNGQITGYSYLESPGPQFLKFDFRAFLYDDGAWQDLGTLGGSYSEGRAINNKGQITGRSTTSPGDPGQQFSQPNAHAFLYSDGTMKDLGTLGGSYSAGSAINDKGEVTGTASLAGDTEYHAFLYIDGTMHDLNDLLSSRDSGWVLRGAKGVNDAGQIVGYGDFNGESRSFLLTPLTD